MATKQSSLPSTTQLQLVIGMLTVVIKIAKYLPYIVFGFATMNLTLAILDFAVWGNFVVGFINTILAIGGFILVGQLIQRRVSRREHITQRYSRITTPASETEPRTNEPYIRNFRDQEAA